MNTLKLYKFIDDYNIWVYKNINIIYPYIDEFDYIYFLYKRDKRYMNRLYELIIINKHWLIEIKRD